MKINLFRLHIFSKFSGARAYLEAMVRAIPEARTRELTDLKRFAESADWANEDYECERQEVEGLFEYTMPQVLSRSFLVYLHGIVVQLHAVADHLGGRRKVDLRAKDLAGSAIERVRIYFLKVLGLSIGNDPGWAQLRDLAALRNVIVHQGSIIGSASQERNRIRQLAEKYPGIAASNGWDGAPSELEFSLDVCLNFADVAERFFDRLFVHSGLGKAALVESEVGPLLQQPRQVPAD